MNLPAPLNQKINKKQKKEMKTATKKFYNLMKGNTKLKQA